MTACISRATHEMVESTHLGKKQKLEHSNLCDKHEQQTGNTRRKTTLQYIFSIKFLLLKYKRNLFTTYVNEFLKQHNYGFIIL